jgi:hypothetical protein
LLLVAFFFSTTNTDFLQRKDVLVVQHRHDSGWWMGSNIRTAASGWFGPACVEALVSGDTALEAPGERGITATAKSSFDGSIYSILRSEAAVPLQLFCIDYCELIC